MNEDVKKNLRTQGKYSGGPNNRDKRQKESPSYKEPLGKISHAQKRNSNGHKDKNNSSFSDVAEDESPIKYQGNSSHSFSELEEVKKPTEIRSSGYLKLSETQCGVSSILYEPKFMEHDDADQLLGLLLDTTEWSDKKIVIRGEEYPQPRLVAWYGPFPYTYSGVTLKPAEMPIGITMIKDRIEVYLREQGKDVSFNSVLLNYYRNGKDSVAWHSDDELTMAIHPTIASISLGEIRRFEMKRKINSYEDGVPCDGVEECFMNLTHGSLLVMDGCMQLDWQHRVPKEYHDKQERVNLTFRTVSPLDRIPEILSKEKHSNLEVPTKNGRNFNEDDFPPLISAAKSVSVKTEECDDIKCLNSIKNDDIIDKTRGVNNEPFITPHMNDVEPEDNQLGNNLNDSKQKSECDWINKNINLGDSFTNDGDVSNTDNSIEENAYIKPPVAVTSHINNAQKTLLCAVDNPVPNQKLNVNAQIFVPSTSPIPSYKKNDYSAFNLEQLLEHYKRNVNDDDLQNYAEALRNKVVEYGVEHFEYFVENNLIFLIALMEESQSLRTQRLITERMYKILYENFDELDNFRSDNRSSKLHGSYSERQCNKKEYGNSHSETGNFRDMTHLGRDRDEMYNRKKGQNVGNHSREGRGGYLSRENRGKYSGRRGRGDPSKEERSGYPSKEVTGDYVSGEDPQKGRNSNEGYHVKRNKNYNQDCFVRGNRNFNREESYFSHEFQSKEKKSLCRKDSGSDENVSSSGNKSFNRGRGDRHYFRGRRNASRGEFRGQINNSREREYSSQELYNREEIQANPESSSRKKGQSSKENISDRGDRNVSKGYSKNRKDSMPQENESAVKQ